MHVTTNFLVLYIVELLTSQNYHIASMFNEMFLKTTAIFISARTWKDAWHITFIKLTI